MHRHLLLLIFIIFEGLYCFSQNTADLFEQVEKKKKEFMQKGLDSLDAIEGIYFVTETQDWKFGDSPMSGPASFERCVAIQSFHHDAFMMLHYVDSLKQFWANGFIITRQGDQYFLRKHSSSLDVPIQFHNNIFFVEYKNRMDSDLSRGIDYIFKSKKKIFPQKDE